MSSLLRVVTGSPTITCYYGGPTEEAIQEIEGERVWQVHKFTTACQGRYMENKNSFSQTDSGNERQEEIGLRGKPWDKWKQKNSDDLFQAVCTKKSRQFLSSLIVCYSNTSEILGRLYLYSCPMDLATFSHFKLLILFYWHTWLIHVLKSPQHQPHNLSNI